MKIAVISDIHGNIEALNAVLADIENQNTDRLFILGDLAMAGADPEKTVDTVIELIKTKNAVCILGNTDEMVIKGSGTPGDGYTPGNPTMAASLKYSKQILRPEQIEFLKQLPQTHSEKIGELSFLLVHGSPRQINENISPDLDEETLKEIISEAKEDVILCGHTHLPVVYKVNLQTIINDGSVGRPFTENPDACYAVINYPDLNSKEFSVEHKFVDYDRKTTAKKLESLPFEGGDKLASVILNPETRHALF
jgi:putative phosphoesterase